jgi:hypothetical protein
MCVIQIEYILVILTSIDSYYHKKMRLSYG